jgi:hypothetical protein
VLADATQTILRHFDDSVGRSKLVFRFALLFYFLPQDVLHKYFPRSLPEMNVAIGLRQTRARL